MARLLKTPVKARNTAKAKIAPSDGPRLEVKIIPRTWTASTTAHRPALPQNLADFIGACRLMVATSRVMGMVISMTAAARIGLPTVDDARV